MAEEGTEALDRLIADRVGFLGKLPQAAAAAVLEGSTLTHHRRGATTFEGTEASRIAIVVAGVQRVFLMAADGRQVTIRYVRRGELLGAIRWPAIEARIATQATEDGLLLQLHANRLTSLLPAFPDLGLALADEFAERLAYSYRALHRQAFASTRGQVAADLVLRMEALGGVAPSVINVTNQDIADAVGTVREVVARILSDFAAQGLLTRTRGRITVLAPDRLRSLVTELTA